MSFYGNIADSSHIHFQFDKIFSSRTAMDRACLFGTDGIYAGRFVLVKYDSEVGQSEIKYGYFGVNENSNVLYRDAACTDPYIFTTFSKISGANTNSANWASYYVQVADGNYYARLANELAFQSGQDYWVADAADGNNVFSLVGEGTIVYLKDTAQAGSITNTCLSCTGTTSGQPATWIIIDNDSHEQNYFDNYKLDQRTYGDGFYHRGYDATVWQKTYNQGTGKFVLIASLNAGQPSFEFIQDPPSIEPLSATIDSTSTKDVYKIHVPTHWGFRVKETDNLDKSDVTKDNKHLAIYMNLGKNTSLGETKYHSNERHVDDSNNEILLAPTGRSGTLYNGEEEVDIQELSINLPIIGNMIDKGYDLIYGSGVQNEETGQYVRQRDVNWYEAESNLKLTGSSAYGGKTYDLNTIAGNINTWHKRLGQIIQTHNTRPSLSQISSLNSDYIHYIEDENRYCRIGYTMDYEDVPLTSMRFTNVTISEQEFTINTYYTHTIISGPDTVAVDITAENVDSVTFNSVSKSYTVITKNNSQHLFTVAAGYPAQNDPPVQFAVKNISLIKYKPADIIYYTTNTYYYREGEDYIKDTNLDIPYDISKTYYNINDNDIKPCYFTAAYSSGNYYRKENKNYILAMEDSPLLDTEYYNPDLTNINIYTTVYQPGKYYIIQDGEYVLDNRPNLPANDSENNHHYVIKFDDQPSLGHDAQGHIVLIYAILDGYPKDVYLYQTQYGVDYYLKEGNNYIHISNLTEEQLETPSSNFYYRTSSDNEEAIGFEHLFIQNKYYRLVNGKDFHLEDVFNPSEDAYQQGRFFSILETHELTKPFYEADKYYYTNDNIFFYPDKNNPTSYTEHFTKESLYVKSDTSGRCLVGMEWNDFSLYIPASVELGTLKYTKNLIPMDGVIDDDVSINGALLKFDKIYNPDDTKTRELDTVMGAINTIQDLFYSIKHLIPGRVLYVNEFGQITSSEEGLTYADLIKTVNKVNTNIPD